MFRLGIKSRTGREERADVEPCAGFAEPEIAALLA
jgi:hypothetical protein